jgi:hypothetical protein
MFMAFVFVFCTYFFSDWLLVVCLISFIFVDV